MIGDRVALDCRFARSAIPWDDPKLATRTHSLDGQGRAA